MNIFIPPELASMEPALKRFIDAMVFKLRKNAHKESLTTLDLGDLHGYLQEESKELMQAVQEGNQIEIVLEGADVANFAFLMATVAIEGKSGV